MCKTFECEHFDTGDKAVDRVPIHRLNCEEYRPITIPFGAHLPKTLIEHERAEAGGHCNAQSSWAADGTIEGIDKAVAMLGRLLAFPKLFSRAATVRKAASDSIRSLTTLKAACEHFAKEKNHVPAFIRDHEVKQVQRLTELLKDKEREIAVREAKHDLEVMWATQEEKQTIAKEEDRRARAAMAINALRRKRPVPVRPGQPAPVDVGKPAPVRKPRPKKKAAKKAKSRPRTPSTSKALQPAPMPKLIAERMAGSVNGHTNGVLNGKH